MMDIKRLMESSGVFQYGVIDPEQVHFADEVRSLCEVNTCRQYGKTWACPPAVGTVAECKAQCLRYRHMLVFTGKYELEDSFDFEGMQDGMKSFKQMVRAIHEAVRPELDDYLILGNEGCDTCGECTYPDAPCRFPDQLHGSIEGYGVYVNELAETAGINYINGKDTVTYFGALLYN